MYGILKLDGKESERTAGILAIVAITATLVIIGGLCLERLAPGSAKKEWRHEGSRDLFRMWVMGGCALSCSSSHVKEFVWCCRCLSDVFPMSFWIVIFANPCQSRHPPEVAPVLLTNQS